MPKVGVCGILVFRDFVRESECDSGVSVFAFVELRLRLRILGEVVSCEYIGLDIGIRI